MSGTPGISEALAQVIAADPFARHLGIELLDLQPGRSRMVMPLASYMDNFNGLAHGGAIFTLADTAFAAASNAHGTVAVALSMTIHFLRSPQIGTRLIAEARESRLSRRAGFYEITVTGEDGQAVAVAQGVVHRREGRVTGRRPEDGDV